MEFTSQLHLQYEQFRGAGSTLFCGIYGLLCNSPHPEYVQMVKTWIWTYEIQLEVATAPLSTIYWPYSIYFLATRSQSVSLKNILKGFHSYNFRWNEYLVMPLIWHGTPNANPIHPLSRFPCIHDVTWPPLAPNSCHRYFWICTHTHKYYKPPLAIIDIMAFPLVGTSSDMICVVSTHLHERKLVVVWSQRPHTGKTTMRGIHQEENFSHRGWMGVCGSLGPSYKSGPSGPGWDGLWRSVVMHHQW